MRKIEQDMLAAIRCAKSYWKQANTEIKSGIMPSGHHRVYVYLHGNEIAYCDVDRSSRHIGRVKVNHDVLASWPTVTTKSRLRALGVDLTQTKGKIYIDNQFICEA